MKKSRNAFNCGLLTCVSAVSLILGATEGASAQQADASKDVEQVVVTGSRLQVSGFTAPTPTTTVSTDEINATALPNIADVLNQLPQFQGSNTPATNNEQTSTGLQGQNVLSLRNLGSYSNGVGSASRTLVLMDGRRVTPTGPYGTTDINNIPSQLIQRVDVVNGGASAAYGSDAVSGVVNFILDKKFTGLKGEIDGGISSRSDDAARGANLTYGTGLFGDKAHLLVSVSGQRSDGVSNVLGRNWYQQIEQITNPAFVSHAATPNIPALITFPHVNVVIAQGGLINSGPLKGTEFGPGGTMSNFQYGSPIAGVQMVGGEHEDVNTAALVDRLTNLNAFTYMDYEFNDWLTGFFQFNFGNSHASGNAFPNTTLLGGSPTILATNPYVPASLAARMVATGVPSFKLSTLNQDLGVIRSDDFRETGQMTVGFNGKLGGSWTWNGYYQFGQSNQWENIRNQYNISKLASATNVIVGPNGAPACASFATNPACVPLNILGTGVATPQAIAYVTGNANVVKHYVQQVAEASVNGEPFSTWAGPVPVVAGAGYRSESIATPFVDPVSMANGWALGNFGSIRGSYRIWELFGEADVPLAKDEVWARALDIDAAVRLTNYSNSGTVDTWKFGANYRPIQDVLVRGFATRDIRAPSLSELNGGGSTLNTPETDPLNNNAQAIIPLSNAGNLDLKPEISHSYGLGAVYTPSWLEGFSVSADYWQFNISNAITPLSAPTEIQDCASGAIPALCSRITRGTGPETGANGVVVTLPNAILAVTQGPANVAQISATGIDFEIGYRKDLSEWFPEWDAAMTFRAFGTHNMSNIIDNGPGTRHEYAGQMAGGNNPSVPLWQWNVSAFYLQGPWTVSSTWRWISAGLLSTSFFDNSAGPLTVDNNSVAAASYLDLGLSYKFKIEASDVELYTRVSNVLDQDPPVIAGVFNSQQYNPALYDGIGRYYRVGLRFMLP